MGQHIETYRKMIEKDPAFSEVSRQMVSSGDGSFQEQMTYLLLAPVAVSFAAWVLREAVVRKIDRVYFLARDGWQFYQAARALQKSWKLPVEMCIRDRDRRERSTAKRAVSWRRDTFICLRRTRRHAACTTGIM